MSVAYIGTLKYPRDIVSPMLQEHNGRTWMFDVEGFYLDAPQQAKSKVAEENEDVEYRHLRARIVKRPITSRDTAVVVVCEVT